MLSGSCRSRWAMNRRSSTSNRSRRSGHATIRRGLTVDECAGPLGPKPSIPRNEVLRDAPHPTLRVLLARIVPEADALVERRPWVGASSVVEPPLTRQRNPVLTHAALLPVPLVSIVGCFLASVALLCPPLVRCTPMPCHVSRLTHELILTDSKADHHRLALSSVLSVQHEPNVHAV
jgi:hypothetical protein